MSPLCLSCIPNYILLSTLESWELYSHVIMSYDTWLKVLAAQYQIKLTYCTFKTKLAWTIYTGLKWPGLN